MAITIEGGITIGPGITMGDSGKGGGTIQSTSPRTINTTPAYLNANYNFTRDSKDIVVSNLGFEPRPQP